MSRMKSHGRTDVTKGSRRRMSILEGGSDQDILMSHAQSEPKVETSIQSDPEHMSQRRKGSFEGTGIMKSIEVSTSYVHTSK
jgi:hypothetical protein